MKSIKVLIFAGVVIIITSLICFTGRDSMYEKKDHYNSPEEIIDVLNTKTLNAIEENDGLSRDIVNTDNFKECLSKRKRITGSLINFSTLDIHVDSNYDEESIKKSYLDKVSRLKDYNPGENIKAYSLTGSYKDPYKNSGNIKMDIVFIDEGEGYVIDYIKYDFGDTSNINVE